jgi:hypothetical protein
MRIAFDLFCLILCLSICTPNMAVADDDDNHASVSINQTSKTDNDEIIKLSVNSQILAGVKTQILAAVHQQPEITAYGTIISLEPLLQLRQQFLATRAQQDSAKAKYIEAQLNFARTENLHKQEIVSTRRLQEQEALWRSEKANLNASDYQQQAILASSRLEWGNILTDWFVLSQSKDAEQFLNQSTQLLQITLPVNYHLNPQIHSILIDEQGQRNNAIQAFLISPSPKIDPISQGERYFFKSKGRKLPYGSHITAWINNDSRDITGVIVPKTALVWHLGQAFVYVKTKENMIVKKLIPEFSPDKNGFFVTGSLQPNDEIVTIGAQTLLSLQLKALIPAEDSD